MSTDYEDTPETEDAIRMHGYPGGHEIFPTTERYDAKAAEVLGERPSSVVTLISCTDIKVFFFFFFFPLPTSTFLGVFIFAIIFEKNKRAGFQML